MKKILILALIVLSAHIQAVQDNTAINDKIAKIEKRLAKIRSSQASATNIDPEFNDDFDREIAEKEGELNSLKQQLNAPA